MRNRYEGKCLNCLKKVGRGEGHFERKYGRWHVRCLKCTKMTYDTTTESGRKLRQEQLDRENIDKLKANYKKYRSPMILVKLEKVYGVDLDIDESPDGEFNRG